MALGRIACGIRGSRGHPFEREQLWEFGKWQTVTGTLLEVTVPLGAVRALFWVH